MSTDAAELSSLATLLDDVVRRVGALADRRGGGDDPDELTTLLYEAERALLDGQRRLQRAVDAAG